MLQYFTIQQTINCIYYMTIVLVAFNTMPQKHHKAMGARRWGGGVGRVDTRPPWKIPPIFSLYGGPFLLLFPLVGGLFLHVGAFLLLFSSYERPFSPRGAFLLGFFSPMGTFFSMWGGGAILSLWGSLFWACPPPPLR